MAVPREPPGFQQDLRRLAAPGHPGRRRRLLLARRRALPEGLVRLGAESEHRDPRPANRMVDLRRHDPGRARGGTRREHNRDEARPAVSDRDLHGRLRRRPLGGRPLAAGSGNRQAGLLDGACDRRLADPGVDPRSLALGNHDHDRPLRPARPRCGCTLRLPAPDPDRLRRGPLQGRQAPPADGTAGRLDGAVPRRDAGGGGRRPDCDRPPARLPAPSQLHVLRDLPARPRGRDPDRDRERLAGRTSARSNGRTGKAGATSHGRRRKRTPL